MSPSRLERWLTGYRALAALAEDTHSIRRTHAVAYKPPQLQFPGIWCPLVASMGPRHEHNSWHTFCARAKNPTHVSKRGEGTMLSGFLVGGVLFYC